jgi:hypothetical protein
MVDRSAPQRLWIAAVIATAIHRSEESGYEMTWFPGHEILTLARRTRWRVQPDRSPRRRSAPPPPDSSSSSALSRGINRGANCRVLASPQATRDTAAATIAAGKGLPCPFNLDRVRSSEVLSEEQCWEPDGVDACGPRRIGPVAASCSRAQAGTRADETGSKSVPTD